MARFSLLGIREAAYWLRSLAEGAQLAAAAAAGFKAAHARLLTFSCRSQQPLIQALSSTRMPAMPCVIAVVQPHHPQWCFACLQHST